MTPERCARCQKEAPPHTDAEHLDWETLDGHGMVCPSCITGAEQQAMDEADMATNDEVGALSGICSRCFDDVPYRTDDPGEVLPPGWMALDADANELLILCPKCADV